MQEITNIISLLTDDRISLNAALLKTKVLLSEHENEDVLIWINCELQGYEGFMFLPDYRRINCISKYSYTNSGFNYQHQPFSIPALPNFNIFHLRESIVYLERFKSKENGEFKYQITSDLVTTLERMLRNVGNPDLTVHEVYKLISVANIHNVLSTVRNRLLDFLLLLNKKLGGNSLEALKNNSEVVNKIFHMTINNVGDGNINNIGDNNVLTGTIKISKGDKKELGKILEKYNLDQYDISELVNMIDNDNHDFGRKVFGKNVKSWYEKMIEKANNGIWDITAATAGGVLTEVLNKYLGF